MSLSGETSTLETGVPLHAEAPERRQIQPNRWRRSVGALLLSAGVLAACGGGDTAQVRSATAETTSPSPSESGDRKVDALPVPTTTRPNARENYGNIRIAEPMAGDQFISVTRGNGEIIQVPKLRTLNDVQAFGESALGLYSCYMSTGNQECLESLTPSARLQSYLSTQRQQYFLDPLARGRANPGDFQMTVYDESAQAAQFTFISGADSRIALSGGPVYIQMSDDPTWQGIESTANWSGYVIDEFDIRYYQDSDGSAAIQGIEIELRERPRTG